MEVLVTWSVTRRPRTRETRIAIRSGLPAGYKNDAATIPSSSPVRLASALQACSCWREQSLRSRARCYLGCPGLSPSVTHVTLLPRAGRHHVMDALVHHRHLSVRPVRPELTDEASLAAASPRTPGNRARTESEQEEERAVQLPEEAHAAPLCQYLRRKIVAQPVASSVRFCAQV